MREVLIILSNINFKIDESEKDLIDSDRNIISEVLNLNNRDELRVNAMIFTDDLSYGDKALKSAISLGVDKAYIIEKKDFDFYNIRLVSKYLAKAIKENFNAMDAIFFGRLSYTGDSFLLASALADELGYNRILNSKFFLLDEVVKIRKEIDYNIDYEMKVKYPVVISSIREDVKRKYASILNLMKAYNDSKIEKIDITITKEELLEIFKSDYEYNNIEVSSEDNGNCQFIELENDKDVAIKIIEKLEELGFVVK